MIPMKAEVSLVLWRRITIGAVLGAGLVSPPVGAQLTWLQSATAATPSARHDHVLVSQPASGSALLFGGLSLAGEMSDTWEWDGASWTQRQAAVHPPARYGHGAACDPASQRVVLFGGNAGGVLLGDTWIWDGSGWGSPSSATRPLARYLTAMAADAPHGQIILFGGYGSGSALSDTWIWAGSAWSRLTPALSPSSRYGHALVSQDFRGRVLLFGGRNAAFVLGDTWEWDGTTWTQRFPATNPSARHGHSLAYDPIRERAVLFGGIDASQARLGDTWEWDGTDWSQAQAPVAPSARYSHAATLDPVSHRMVTFGGVGDGQLLDDTWTYGPTHIAFFETFGTGCTGSGGLPAVSAYRLPRAGHTFGLLLSHLPISQPGLLFVGISRTGWGLFPLPLRLDPIGMTGCLLLTSGEMLVPIQSTGTTGTCLVGLPIPDDPALLGNEFFSQAFLVDPEANPGNLITTNAGRVIIGS